mgnify:CR=1 FL=1
MVRSFVVRIFGIASPYILLLDITKNIETIIVGFYATGIDVDAICKKLQLCYMHTIVLSSAPPQWIVTNLDCHALDQA